MKRKPTNSGKRWSTFDLKHLKDMIKKHTPTQKIASELKRTMDAIYAKTSEMHLSLKPAMATARHHGHMSRSHVSKGRSSRSKGW
jgi:hypothetical protein